MFINRQLRIALLISFLWHLFCLSSVSIIFLPVGLKQKQYCSVYFLGSILRGPISFGQIHYDNKKHFVELPLEAVDQMKGHFSGRPYTSLPLERGFLNPEGIIEVDAHLRQGPPSLFEQRRISPVASAKEDYSGPSLKNSSQQREIIFQPSFPEYPEWIGSQEFRASPVIFKIYISGDGLVQEIINVQASGDPEIDVILARYIKRWRFAPAFSLQGQWQTVRLSLDVENEKKYITTDGHR